MFPEPITAYDVHERRRQDFLAAAEQRRRHEPPPDTRSPRRLGRFGPLAGPRWAIGALLIRLGGRLQGAA